MLEFLSERGRKWVRTLPPLVKAHFDNFYNMYDKETNPKGLINMGTAESHLVNTEVCDLLRKASERMDLTGYNIHYNKFEGSDEFRSAIAGHWQKIVFGDDSAVRLDKENVATCAGCTVALETLAMLLAEPGDVFLIPAPYYSSFVDDINERAGVIPVGVPCDETLDGDAFEEAYAKTVKEGKRVRAVLFSSPNNPIGTVYKEEAVRGLLDFAMEHDLDVISDEIYAQTVFDPEAGSGLIPPQGACDEQFCQRLCLVRLQNWLVHLIQSLYHTGLCVHHILCVSIFTYPVAADGAAEITGTSGHHGTFKTASRRCVSHHCRGPCGNRPTMKAQAGIFVMADFSAYMEKQEFEAEHVLWEKIYHELMINVSPGQLFGCDRPGWFRACYAFDQDTVEEACRRLATLKK